MKMIALLFALMTTTAFAAEVKVLDVPAWGMVYKSASFSVNRELGRAWVEVTLKEPHADRPRHLGTTSRHLVPGLSFDGSTIRFDHEGQMFECASVVQSGRSIFRHNVITNTNCGFTAKEVIVLRDTGFEVIKERRLQVFLVTK